MKKGWVARQYSDPRPLDRASIMSPHTIFFDFEVALGVAFSMSELPWFDAEVEVTLLQVLEGYDSRSTHMHYELSCSN